MHKRKYYMDYKLQYLLIDVAMVLSGFSKALFHFPANLFREVVKMNQITEMNYLRSNTMRTIF